MTNELRPPIVVILGHVDHGKTTLLDFIRTTNVAAREAGGITQGIGASVVKTKNNKEITFIDTPGHAAFNLMRERGANIADVAVLVVAGDDGVKPQTKEALEYIKKTGNLFLVAITKSDLTTSNTDAVIGQLEKEQVKFEKRGGEVPIIEVSGKTGKGIDDLLETILLLHEVSNVKSEPNAPLSAFVIETRKEKSGNEVSVVVKNGTLKPQSTIYSGQEECKVRALFDWTGKRINEVYPGYPVKLLGFKHLPEIGSEITSIQGSLVVQKTISQSNYNRATQGKKLIVKADNAGMLEAVLAGLPQEFAVIDSGVGDITENDIFIAKSGKARIYSIGLKTTSSIRILAKNEKVILKEFDIIYKLFEDAEELLKEGEIEIKGKATVLDIFPFSGKTVAGCKINMGVIKKGDKISIRNGDTEIGQATAVSLRKGKVETEEVKAGEEFGLLLKPQLEIAKGYDILSVILPS